MNCMLGDSYRAFQTAKVAMIIEESVPVLGKDSLAGSCSIATD